MLEESFQSYKTQRQQPSHENQPPDPEPIIDHDDDLSDEIDSYGMGKHIVLTQCSRFKTINDAFELKVPTLAYN